MSDNIEEIPTEEVIVEPKPTGIKSKVGSDEFVKQFVEVIKQGPVWRSTKKLAELLNCDPIDLATWMDRQTELLRRPGKEEGTVYYAFTGRVEAQAKEEKRPPGMERKQIVTEDGYAVAMLHQTYSNLVNVLEKYGMHVYNRNKEALAKLVEGREAVSAGISLLANTLQIDVTKLPKL
jgi:hypothetical protein